MKRKIMIMPAIALCIVWVALIFLFSSQNGTSSHGTSNSVGRFVASILYPDFSSSSSIRQAEILDSLDPLIRKCAHYFEYTVLGCLCFLAVRRVMIRRRVRRRTDKPFTKMGCGLIAFYPCIVISACDEVFQISVTGRTSSVLDVLLDGAGVVTGLIICAVKTRDVSFRRDVPTNRHRKGGSL